MPREGETGTMADSYFFDRFHNRYIITGRLTAITALHIGAGEQSVRPATVDKQVIKDALGRPFIPGSSLKGAWRSFMERVLAAGHGRGHGVPVCAATVNPCLRQLSREEREALQRSDDPAQEIYNRLCPVCRLFGNQYFGGKVFVQDLPVIEETWVGFYDTRTGVGIDRDTRTRANRILYDFEAVPAGTQFAFTVVAENLEEEAWYNLLLGLRGLVAGDVFLGGLASRGLGRVALEGAVVTTIASENLVDSLISGKQASRSLDEVFAAAGLAPATGRGISRSRLLASLQDGPEELSFDAAMELLRRAQGGDFVV